MRATRVTCREAPSIEHSFMTNGTERGGGTYGRGPRPTRFRRVVAAGRNPSAVTQVDNNNVESSLHPPLLLGDDSSSVSPYRDLLLRLFPLNVNVTVRSNTCLVHILSGIVAFYFSSKLSFLIRENVLSWLPSYTEREEIRGKEKIESHTQTFLPFGWIESDVREG